MFGNQRMSLAALLGSLALSVSANTQSDVRVLDSADGLSDNFVSSVCQDANGYIWIATELGVNRFGGNSFRAFYKGETTGNEICKVESVGKSVFVASRRDGLAVFDVETETFSHMTSANGRLSANDITDVTSSPDGDVWISYYWDGIDYVMRSSIGDRLVHYDMSTLSGLGSNQVWTVADDGHGILYVGHVDAGLSVVNTGNMKVENFRHSDSDANSLPDDEVFALQTDKRGGVWVGTNHGLAYFIDGHFIRVRDVPARIRSIKQVAEDVIWVGVENGGVYAINNAKGIFISQEALQVERVSLGAVDNRSVQSISADSYGNVWLGTFGGGVAFVGSRDQFASQWNTLNQGLCWRVAWGMTTDRKGRIWVGTDGGGIDVFDDGRIVQHYDSANSDLGDNAILSALCDSEGDLWFGTFARGLFVFDVSAQRFIPIPLSAKAVDIRCIMEVGQQIVVGSNDGICCVDKQSRKLVRHITKSNSHLPDDLVRSLATDDKGNWWVGTFGRGVSVFSPDGFMEKASLRDSLFIANTIHHIFRDKQDRIWVATGNGLAMVNSDNPTSYTSFGVAGLVVYAVAEGRNGQIWVSTNVGISCVDASNGRILNFDSRDGAPRGVYRGGSVTRGVDGTLYFGSENGVAIVGTDLGRWPSMAPCARVTGFRYCSGAVMSDEMESLPISLPIELDHNNNIFSVEFGVPDYSYSDQVEFAFKMDGIDADWHHAGSNREITFRNVPPGDYEFRVRTRMRSGEWSLEDASLAIRVLPPLWLTWWAKTFYALLVIGAIWLGLWMNTRHLKLMHNLQLARENNARQKELDDERVRFITNMTHELRTPLTLMLGPLEDLKNDTQIPMRESNRISLIYNSGVKLLGMINRLMDYRKTETNNRRLCVKRGSLVNMVKEIVSSYKELNRNRELTYGLHIDPQLPERMLFDHDALSTIVTNLLSNAVKYTPTGSITVDLAKVAMEEKDGCPAVRISVSDTGCGIPEDSIARIWDRYYQVEDTAHHTSGTGIGLSLVRNLVELHDGTVTVKSVLGAGATFDVVIPIRETWDNAVVLADDVSAGASASMGSAVSAEVSDDKNAKRLLIVEDNEEILGYVRDTFEGEFEVSTATNGKEGLDKARELMPDIIISDIMMPEMDGTEMCQLLKQDVATSHIPIILLTAKDSTADRIEGYQKGADSYLTKPFSSSVLRSRIENLIESRECLAKRIRHAEPDGSHKSELAESVNRIDAEFLEKVTTIISDNIENENIDVDFIGSKVGMSHSTFYRKIKALTGLTANEFLRKIKMQNAERLLLTQRYTVAEVSYMVGISSVPYFRQCFKDEYGLSPSAYVKFKTGVGDDQSDN